MRNKKTKRKRNQKEPIDEELSMAIRIASKSLSEAKRSYDQAWPDPFKKLAEVIGYGNPDGAKDLIMEFIEEETSDFSEDNLERLLKIHSSQQQLDWKMQELEEEKEKIDAQIKQLRK